MMQRSPLTRALLTSALAVLGLGCSGTPGFALSPPHLMKESFGDSPAGAPVPCSAPASIDGNCGNYRWYNFCSGYIWLWTGFLNGDECGTSFKASDGLPCIAPGNVVKRTLTYFRSTLPGYGSIDILLTKDLDGDGCAENSEPLIASQMDLDPAERWNCSDMGAVIPEGTTDLILSVVFGPGWNPLFVTDTPYECPHPPAPHTFYYGIGRSVCVPFLWPPGPYLNWPVWLVIDSPTTSTENMTWGQIKGLYH